MFSGLSGTRAGKVFYNLFFMNNEENSWLKTKGYVHICGQVDVTRRRRQIVKLINSPDFVAKYPFYPLLHTVIRERKYKKDENGKRGHVHSENGKPKKTTKERPLHYANHFDALIFGCYAQKIQDLYEKEIQNIPALSESIIAYRKIQIPESDSNKSTIHFANEVFSEIRNRLQSSQKICVLTFDIKSFFSSLNHTILKNTWATLLGAKILPQDHYNVFKATTRFSYIMLDDLRRVSNEHNRRAGFNEKELARIRNRHGISAFFASPKHFREKVKSGELKVHRFPFRNALNEPIGIPQGLPISAVLANVYLLDFDRSVYHDLVSSKECFYRRYSDDIVLVCRESDVDFVEKYVTNKMKEFQVEISSSKTEKFTFQRHLDSKITCIKSLQNGIHKQSALIYLGFEFNGNNTFIKSSNLSKFYRRMIESVKRKAKRARKDADRKGLPKPVIFRRQLYRLYVTLPLSKKEYLTRYKTIEKNEYGEYRTISKYKTKMLRSNYLSYVARASEIMGEPAIKNQIWNHRRLFNEAIHRHLNVVK
jgi:hypothetical protein